MHKQNIKYIKLFCLLCLFIFISFASGAAEKTQKNTCKRVLILHSYHKGLEWTDGQENALRKELGTDPDIEIYTEYLDSKRKALEQVSDSCAEFLKQKYATNPPDIIICTDNNALTFLQKRRKKLFPDTPIVFCGINNYHPSMLEGFGGKITGIIQELDPLGTVRLIKKLQPGLKKLAIISGNTPTAQAIKKETEEALSKSKYKDSITILWWDKLTTKELLLRIKGLFRDDAILLCNFNRDAEGKYYTHKESAQMIAKFSPVPVYAMEDHYIGTGVVGGYMNTSATQGGGAAELAMTILRDGEIPPVIETCPNIAMFDNYAMTANNLDDSLLPSDAVVVNKPFSFYKMYRNVIFTASAIFLLLTVTIFILSVNVARRQRSEMNLQVTLQSIGDAVISTDIQGCVTQMNRVAERLTGWSLSDAQGEQLSEVFKIINADTRKQEENPSEKVMKTGEIIGLANHTMLISKDGREYQISDSAAPIKHADGTITGVVLVFRDIDKEYRMQAEIQANKEKYRLIYETSGDAIMTIDPPDWKFTAGNMKIINMFGVKDEREFLTLQPWELSPEFQPDGQRSEVKAKKMIETAMEKGEIFFEWTHKKLRGDVFFATVLLNKIELDGKVFLQARVSDISEQKLIEQKLKNSEERYRTLINNSLVGVLVGEVETKHLRLANPAICKMLGYSESELLKKGIQDIHPPDKLEHVIAEFQAQAEGKKQLASDIPFLKKDGGIFFCDVSTNSTVIDGVKCNIGVVIDVTEKRKAEKVLRDNEEKYRMFFENSSDAMLIIKDGKFIDCNKAAVNMLGYDKKEDFLNTHPAELSPEYQPDGKKSNDKAVEMIESTFVNGSNFFEWDHKKKTGEIFPVEVSLTAISFAGESIIHTIWRDITQRKNAENEVLKMQKLKSIGTLAGGIAHDFNNVLLGIFGNVSLAKLELDENHPAFELIQEVEKSMNRATSLTNQLLTFAKGGEPVKQHLNIKDLIKDITLFTLSGSNVKPVLKEAEDLWHIDADKGQIQQVISNLIINADQAMPSGGTLYTTLTNANIAENSILNLSKGKYVKIVFADEGTGIAAEHLSHIFDPYFTTKQAGNGLGLATVYSIINRHNGHIGVSSELGKGTTFTIYLPSSTFHGDQKNKQPAKAPVSEEKGRILIMDDEEQVRTVTARMLHIRGFAVETAKDGKQVIAKYKKATGDKISFDVVLMDLTIPGGMGGKEAMQELLDFDSDAKVIVFSGYSTDPIMADYNKYGFKGRLVKPFEMEDLIKEISRVINN